MFAVLIEVSPGRSASIAPYSVGNALRLPNLRYRLGGSPTLSEIAAILPADHDALPPCLRSSLTNGSLRRPETSTLNAVHRLPTKTGHSQRLPQWPKPVVDAYAR